MLLLSFGCQQGQSPEEPVSVSVKSDGSGNGVYQASVEPPRFDAPDLPDVARAGHSLEQRVTKAMRLLGSRQMAEAKQEFAEIDAIDPGHAEANFQMGNVAIHFGDLEAAEARFKRALERDPGHSGALEAMGQLCAATERWSDSAGYWNSLLVLVPQHEAASAALETANGHLTNAE